MKITRVQVENFRAIKDITVDFLGNALILVGQNNSGKSSFINAIRVFWGDLQLSKNDFHKDQTIIKILIEFSFEDGFFNSDKLINNKKIGIQKVPSSQVEFNRVKEGTYFEGYSYNDFKEARTVCFEQENTDIITECKLIWVKAIKLRYSIENNEAKIKFIANSNDDSIGMLTKMMVK